MLKPNLYVVCPRNPGDIPFFVGEVGVASGYDIHSLRSAKIHHAIHGKIHYFDWAIFDSYVKLPEGTPNSWMVYN